MALDLPGASPLRAALEEAIEEHGGTMADYTVLATQNDPFRLDTAANHRDGEWLAIQASELGFSQRTIHLRGFHYALLGRLKPDGLPYANDDDTWVWLQAHPAKAARWLKYIPFERIVDQRNAEPVVRTFDPPEPEPSLYSGIDVDLPDDDDIGPSMDIEGFEGIQPYRVVLWGEKSSLEDVLGPLAEQYYVDLYLPTGEISDTLLYKMAKDGATDGRPMIVLVFADCDPGGWQMAISISRKLQALKILFFRDLEFRVFRVALTPDQVREYGLPSTPLKETERRADRWQAAMGVEQTEIDALASLQPDLLRQLALDAIGRFYDATLDQRVNAARDDWLAQAQEVLDTHVAESGLEDDVAYARGRVAEWTAEREAMNEALTVDINELDLPEIEIPEADTDDDAGDLLLVIDSDDDFAEQTRNLIEDKRYGLPQPPQRQRRSPAPPTPPEPPQPRRLIRRHRPPTSSPPPAPARPRRILRRPK